MQLMILEEKPYNLQTKINPIIGLLERIIYIKKYNQEKPIIVQTKATSPLMMEENAENHSLIYWMIII